MEVPTSVFCNCCRFCYEPALTILGHSHPRQLCHTRWLGLHIVPGRIAAHSHMVMACFNSLLEGRQGWPAVISMNIHQYCRRHTRHAERRKSQPPATSVEERISTVSNLRVLQSVTVPPSNLFELLHVSEGSAQVREHSCFARRSLGEPIVVCKGIRIKGKHPV